MNKLHRNKKPCSIPGCQSNWTVFRFPSNPYRIQKWIDLIKDAYPGFKAPTTPFLCIHHFEPQDINKLKLRHRISLGALPVRLQPNLDNSFFALKEDEQLEEKIINSIYDEALKDYGPEYYESQWHRKYQILKHPENPMEWKISRVAKEVAKVTSKGIGNLFEYHQIDGKAMMDLSEEDLSSQMALQPEPSAKILQLIKAMQNLVLSQFILC